MFWLHVHWRTRAVWRRYTSFYTPTVFATTSNSALTFNYFCKPFYTTANRKHLTPLVREQLRRRPFSDMALLPVVKTTNLLPEISYDGIGPESEHVNYMSPISIEYLKKLRDLAHVHGAHLRVIAPPVSNFFDQDYSYMKLQMREEGLEELLDRFFDEMIVRDDSDFEDHIHIRHDLTAATAKIYLQ